MRIAIIEAGASGLTCIKCCKDESLEPVCFEQEDAIGGLWYFTEEERHSSVYRSTVINTSKEMCFSDFPIPKEYPPFMHHDWIMKYLHLYAKSFDLYEYIRYRTKVIDLKKASDYEESGKWEIFFQELSSVDPEEVKKEVYDAVMLCVDHHSEPSWPSFPGMDEFSELKMHSHAYKNVLVVGNESFILHSNRSKYFVVGVGGRECSTDRVTLSATRPTGSPN